MKMLPALLSLGGDLPGHLPAPAARRGPLQAADGHGGQPVEHLHPGPTRQVLVKIAIVILVIIILVIITIIIVIVKILIIVV